jgi:hypothetical protein
MFSNENTFKKQFIFLQKISLQKKPFFTKTIGKYCFRKKNWKYFHPGFHEGWGGVNYWSDQL